jgi:hypothetical protein
LEISQDDLASAARVSLSTVRDFEKGRHVPIANNLAAMKAVLEAHHLRQAKNGRSALDGIKWFCYKGKAAATPSGIASGWAKDSGLGS